MLNLSPDALFDAVSAWADIEQVHAPEYVLAVRHGNPRSVAESQGFRWSPVFADSVARIWSGHCFACILALRAGLVFHPVSGAHHAERDRGSGFCTFNFLAGASRALLRDGLVGRVAIIDVDARPGNGTLELVHDDHRIGLFDIAGSRWGQVPETARVIYRVVSDGPAYRDALLGLPRFLDMFQPDLVMYQAGVDCHEDDPMGGIPGVTAALLEWRDRFVLEHLVRRKIPTVVNPAGGYLPDVSVGLHLTTVRIAAAMCPALRPDGLPGSRPGATRPSRGSPAGGLLPHRTLPGLSRRM